jgi:dihydrolipoamide dehydrogenase
LVAIGRKAYTDNLGLENIGITLNERGQIPVDAHLQTAVPNIYAIGDVIQGAMLAHKAEEEGVFVAEVIAGQKPHINYNLIPGVVYTWPEVAAVGQTENQLKEKGIAYKVGSFPFRALGRARASGDIDGLDKVLADANRRNLRRTHDWCTCCRYNCRGCSSHGIPCKCRRYRDAFHTRIQPIQKH